MKRIDLNIEGPSVENRRGVDNRNKAVRILQEWAAQTHRTLEISYALGTRTDGLTPGGIALLRNAIDNGARVDLVCGLAFDYDDGMTTDMGAAAIGVARALMGQLTALFPSKTESEIRAMTGLVLMPGIDDAHDGTEVTTLAGARRVLAFARAEGLRELSIWAIQRDNGSCPGTGGSDAGSGLDQEDWAFCRILEEFTSGG